MKLGFIINPMAGIGGTVGLKGSDGRAVVDEALSKGAKPLSGERSFQAIGPLAGLLAQPVLTAAGSMGADVLARAGIDHRVIYQPACVETGAEDTIKAVSELCAQGIDLLMFAGGDGTARDVLDAMQHSGVADSLPVVGIPAGCKIHSAVYAVTPLQAGELVSMLSTGQLLSVRQAEVMDLDENAFRDGQVRASCYGYLRVPVDESRMQAVKQGGVNHEDIALQDIAADIVENMEPELLYFIGAGTTTAAVMDELALANTLLGVDVVRNKQLIASDVDEQQMLSLLDGCRAKIIVTAIGGQGHIFGRGNQQFSPAVIEKVGCDNIVVIASNEKLRSLDSRPLLVDTGDNALDGKLRGIRQIITGYEQRTLYNVN